MPYYAVIDTNVIVSGLLARDNGKESPPIRILEAVFKGEIVPLFDTTILVEYEEVLRRKKFSFKENDIVTFLRVIIRFGLAVERVVTSELLPDPKDLVFYEITMAKREEDAYLVTGNLKHYPARQFILTPAEMLEVLRSHK